MRNGFTLVEILVVIAISAMLATVALVYTSSARNEVALAVETAKVAGTILRAKDLAIATYNNSPATCAYGVYLNIPANSYSIFAFNPDPAKYVPASVPPCPSAASTTAAGIAVGGTTPEVTQYSAGTWNVSVANGVRMIDGGNNDTAVIALFYPPSPKTIMSRDGATFIPPASATTLRVYLVTADGKGSTTISVSPAGQITF